MEAPISIMELQTALKGGKSGKAPGPDGFTLAYYKAFTDILSPYFLKAFNAVGQASKILRDTLGATISLIPKPKKDPSQCQSYRPISLLNVDLKLFTKIMAQRMASWIPKLVHLDQVGFVEGREARDNTTKVLNVIHEAQNRSKSRMILLSIDAEKAFDRVNWHFMYQVLEHIGLGKRMMSWVRAIYSGPSARIRVNGQLTEAFSITNGTRQGCPLSPLLFILSLEPFLCYIRANMDISGIKVGTSGMHKLAAYADDLLFFISNPRISLPCLLNEIDRYGTLSFFKVNVQKSEAMNVSLPVDNLEELKSNFSFRWVSDFVSYLGTKMARNLTHLFDLNFLPLLANFRLDLQKWHKGCFSWFGRNSILKMNIMPRLLYLLQALPIKIPLHYFRSLDRIFSQFLWSHKPSRIKRTILIRVKEEGGIAFPSPLNYYKAVHLNRILDWIRHGDFKTWVQLEQAQSSIPLTTLPWCKDEVPREVKYHPTIGATWELSQKVMQQSLISPYPSPLYPITGNPIFVPGLQDPVFFSRQTSVPLRALHLTSTTGWLLTPYQSSESATQELDLWRKRQLSHFLKTLPSCHSFCRPLTPFERECNKKGTIRHALSFLYKLLTSSISDQYISYIDSWEKDLQTTWTQNEKKFIMAATYKTTICTRYQELNFKILSRWYYTPKRLHFMFPSTSDRCWRCLVEEGTLLHIFWACSKIQPFWKDVARLLSKFTDIDIPWDPSFFLLHKVPMSLNRYRKSVLPHLLTAAKSCIPACWKSTTPPAIAMWLAKVGDICRMEDILANQKDSWDKHSRVWKQWTRFYYSEEYTEMARGVLE